MSNRTHSISHFFSIIGAVVGEERRMTRMIYDAFVAVVETGKEEIRPGHVVQYMRDRNNPLGIWNVYGEFSKLRSMGVIELDEDTATWKLVRTLSFEDAEKRLNGQ